ncbi:MAG: MerR family transcriptional regulator [Roseiflexaceae bacterium]
MYKIGDFARIGQVSVRMLRHYDKLGLLVPSHTDRFTSYRYYTIDQLPRLHRIVALNGLGLTLQQISGLLQQGDQISADRLHGMLMVRQAEIERELIEKRVQLAGIAARLKQIEQEGQPPAYEIAIKDLTSLQVIGVRELVPHVAEMGSYCELMYGRLYRTLKQAGIEADGIEITLYHNEEYTETNIDVETSVAYDLDQSLPAVSEPLQQRQLPAEPLAAALLYEGPYETLEDGIFSLLGWIGQQGYTPTGPMRELHLSGPAHINGQLQPHAVIELQIPITLGK